MSQQDLLLLEVGSVSLDDLGQELVFQTGSCDGEVDQGCLSLQFWLVVGIGQFGVKEQLELGVKLDLLVPESDGLALLDQKSTQEWIEDRFDLLVEVLNK